MMRRRQRLTIGSATVRQHKKGDGHKSCVVVIDGWGTGRFRTNAVCDCGRLMKVLNTKRAHTLFKGFNAPLTQALFDELEQLPAGAMGDNLVMGRSNDGEAFLSNVMTQRPLTLHRVRTDTRHQFDGAEPFDSMGGCPTKLLPTDLPVDRVWCISHRASIMRSPEYPGLWITMHYLFADITRAAYRVGAMPPAARTKAWHLPDVGADGCVVFTHVRHNLVFVQSDNKRTMWMIGVRNWSNIEFSRVDILRVWTGTRVDYIISTAHVITLLVDKELVFIHYDDVAAALLESPIRVHVIGGPDGTSSVSEVLAPFQELCGPAMKWKSVDVYGDDTIVPGPTTLLLGPANPDGHWYLVRPDGPSFGSEKFLRLAPATWKLGSKVLSEKRCVIGQEEMDVKVESVVLFPLPDDEPPEIIIPWCISATQFIEDITSVTRVFDPAARVVDTVVKNHMTGIIIHPPVAIVFYPRLHAIRAASMDTVTMEMLNASLKAQEHVIDFVMDRYEPILWALLSDHTVTPVHLHRGWMTAEHWWDHFTRRSSWTSVLFDFHDTPQPVTVNLRDGKKEKLPYVTDAH